jgi:hypothetical protein
LLGPLTSQDGHLFLNKTLQSLHIDGSQNEIEEVGAKAITQMLQTNNTFKATNNTLKVLDLMWTNSLKASDVCMILKSLEKNKTLCTFGLQDCKGVEGDEVLTKLMDLLRFNPWLIEIDLLETPLE